MSASFVAIRYNLIRWQFGSLLAYQIKKLQNEEPIDVLLVGDSSLGNSVDARQWSRKTGKNVVSVALTGVYGLYGSLNMIQRAARHHRLSAVIIMQTVDLMTRVPNRMGNLYTAERLQDIGQLGVLDIIGALATWDVLKMTIWPARYSRVIDEDRIRKFDYRPQAVPLPSKPGAPPKLSLSVSAIQPENFAIAHDIAVTCKRLNIACVYMHGPMYSGICETSARYINIVLDRVRDAGLRVIRRTFCLPWSDVGDTVVHVLPAKKSYYSTEILEAVRPFLEDAAITPRPGNPAKRQ